MQFCPSFNWQVLDVEHIEEILRGLFVSVTIFKVFRNMYLQPKEKKTQRNSLKEEISITVASWIIWVLRLEGKRNSSDRWIYASSSTSLHTELYIFEHGSKRLDAYRLRS